METKSFSLIMLDLIYWVMPEIEIFGETVRDLLVCDNFYNLNVTITKPVRNFHKKMQKLRDSLEIHGYLMKVEGTQNYQNSWPKFETNFIRFGITQGIIQKVGDSNSQIRIYLMTPEKIKEYQPIFRCNLLKMDRLGSLSIIEISEDDNQLTNSRVNLMNQILGDIYSKKATPIDPIKIRSGFEDRFHRSKLIYMLIELMEKGWKPNGFTLEDCGFNLTIAQINNYRSSFEYPDIDRIYHRILVDNTDQEDIYDTDLCPVCQEQLVKQSIIRLKCDHLFHNHCIYQHFHKIGSNSSKCPICRAIIVREDIPPVYRENISVSTSEESSTEVDNSEEIELEHVIDQAIEQVLSQSQDLEVTVNNYQESID